MLANLTPSPDLLSFMIPLMYGASFAALIYVLMSGVKDAMDGDGDATSRAASRELENLFLFVPASKIASISQTAAFIAFLIGFMLVGNLTPAGMAQGSVVGLLMAAGIRALPSFVIRVLRKRRLEKFNEQLVEALVSMSNSLRAGFSIQQAFESVVQEGRKPIAQEFGVFVQQTRVGVRFEDALLNLEERVKSEDLTLMIRAVEIARQTGGNLTEVFDLIASTIRERTRIEGRIKAMTAMGRLQGIVVGLIPVFLLIVMTTLDPEMMIQFYKSPMGIAMLVLVVFLLTVGFMVIKKIVDIEV